MDKSASEAAVSAAAAAEAAVPQLIFLTYGNQNYLQSLARITREAREFPFSQVIGVTEMGLAQQFPEFWERHREFIQQSRRGAGYWIWKSFLVQQLLRDMRDGDTVCYADAGCAFNPGKLPRFREYVDSVRSGQPLLAFSLGLPQKHWTKMDTAVALGGEAFLDRAQCVGGIFLLRKCAQTVALVDEWVAACASYHLIDDSPSAIANDPGFQEHRHDQSVWTNLVYKYGFAPIPDESWPVDGPNSGPILAARIRA